jgi:hypothetical protein
VVARDTIRRTLTLALGALVVSLFALVPACSGDASVTPAPAADGGDSGATPAPRGTLRVDAAAALRTREDGTRATFTVALGSRPSGSVVVPLSSSDEGETKVEPSALSFSPDDWATPKTVTLIGQDDDASDGDQEVKISIGGTTSSDPDYNGVTAKPVVVINTDDDAAGIETSVPFPSANTNETGGVAQFTVRLRSRPTADVTLPVTSTRPTEGAPDKATLTFTAATWSEPQAVFVTGQNDATADGDQPYKVVLGKAQTTDAAYAALAPAEVALVNQDDDIPGFFVSGPSPSAKTTEAGGKVTFTVRLRSRPTGQVTIPVGSSDPAEGTPDVGALAFGPGDYDRLQTITVTGQNDFVDDGDKAYAIVLRAAVSADAAYSGLTPPAVALTNVDDDTASVQVSAPAPSNQTTEAGGKVTFTVRLGSEPTADVTIGVTSSKPAEGKPDVSQLVFTPGDWSVPQTVTVAGQPDDVDDGNVAYDIVLAKATSADAKYAAIDPPDVALVNVDDDTAGISVGAPLPGSTTTEAGAKVTVSVVLQSQPLADVKIPVSVSKPAEATSDKAELVFTSANWSVAQTITVTGKDDSVDDGDQAYSLVLGAATSADVSYAGKNPPDVSLTNTDDDTAGLVVSAAAPSTTTTETGGSVSFDVRLASQPLADVTIPIASTKPTEGKPDKAQLVFTSANWNITQTVTVTGQADNVDDGDQAYAISIGATTSGDALYAGRTGSVALTNTDACGNGATDAGEQCDDSNDAKCDGCESCERRRWVTLPAGASGAVAGITAALPRGNMCVEAWAYVGPPASGDAVIVSSYGATDDGAFILRCQNVGAVTGRIAFAHEVTGASVAATADNTACSDGNWHHFAGCRSVAAGVVTNTVFLDGVLQATATGPATTIGANAAVVVGGTTLGADGLVGAVDEVRISTVVRYAANFTPARRHAADASTLALWHLDDGSGTSFADASGNAYAGALSAGAGWAVDTGYSAAVCQ